MRVFALFLVATLSVSGCNRDADNSAPAELVLYTSVDEPVAARIVAEFERRTGIRVRLQTDTEATKSVGLAARLEAERNNPRADAWWGNEVFHTVNLAEAGLLAPYESPGAADIPAQFKDPQHRWAGVGLRARVIVLHGPAPAPGAEVVTGLEDLTHPRLKGEVAMADPAAGTTGGHVAALYVLWGDEKARAFFRALRDNDVKLLGGNSDVAEQVGRGTLAAGLTDNDDAAAALRAGLSLHAVLPDQAGAGPGTLTIPTTVALVSGSRNSAAAKTLIDYLLSPEVERRLIDANFARYSVRAGPGGGVRSMDVDYHAAAKVLPRAVNDARAILRKGGS